MLPLPLDLKSRHMQAFAGSTFIRANNVPPGVASCVIEMHLNWERDTCKFYYLTHKLLQYLLYILEDYFRAVCSSAN